MCSIVFYGADFLIERLPFARAPAWIEGSGGDSALNERLRILNLLAPVADIALRKLQRVTQEAPPGPPTVVGTGVNNSLELLRGHSPSPLHNYRWD
jgi:hypothetical protein